MGTGSAMAHRAVDSVMGPRTMHVETTGAPSAEAAPVPCAQQMSAFQGCVDSSNGDLARCQMYYEVLQACRKPQATASAWN